ncbi:hypothetical protein SRHO_G00126670 [Serrasalmus rhombeus]
MDLFEFDFFRDWELEQQCLPSLLFRTVRSLKLAGVRDLPHLPCPASTQATAGGPYITRLAPEERLPLSANLICAWCEKVAVPGSGPRAPAATIRAKSLSSWHPSTERRLPSAEPTASFCHLPKESQMLWNDKVQTLAKNVWGCKVRGWFGQKGKVTAFHLFALRFSMQLTSSSGGTEPGARAWLSKSASLLDALESNTGPKVLPLHQI